MKLYEILDNINDILYEVGEDGEINNITFSKLEQLELSLREKIENVGIFLKNTESDVKQLKEAENELKQKRKVLENKKERIKEYLHFQMEKAGIDKVKGKLFTVTLAKCPPSVTIIDENNIPSLYKKEVTQVKIDKREILNRLKAGDEVDGVFLEKNKKTIRVK